MSGRYAAQLGARAHEVSVRALGEARFAVTIDGREAVWEGQELVGNEWLLRDEETGRTHAVLLDRADDGVHTVLCEGLQLDVDMLSPREHRQRAASGASAETAGAGNVCAAMPGRVVVVMVSVGQQVSAGQPLAVIEAMKMENELCAPWDAEVVSVATKAGCVVAGGALVCTLKAQTPGPGPGPVSRSAAKH